MTRYGHGIHLFIGFLICIAGMANAKKPESLAKIERKPAETFISGASICGRLPASSDELHVTQEDGTHKKSDTLTASGNDTRVALFLNTYCDKNASVSSNPGQEELTICCIKK